MQAELKSPKKLGTLLKVRLPKAWPPPLNDEQSQRWMLAYLEKHARSRWGMWYITLPGQLIGNCGFKGEPANGAVELGYSVAPEYHRRGFASEAVRGLVRFAFADPRVRRVLGETLPELIPSIGVLRKCGFVRVNGGSESGVIRFSITRKKWNQSL
jgi:RimJ/RimL family protein N-acetyltransferase